MGILEESPDGDLSMIAAGNGPGDLLARLDDLSRRTSRVLERRPARAAEMRQLAGYLTEIRRLLAELSRLPARRDGRSPSPPACRELAGRYLELEGLAKELRNDLASS